jgi:hypothetical protein
MLKVLLENTAYRDSAAFIFLSTMELRATLDKQVSNYKVNYGHCHKMTLAGLQLPATMMETLQVHKGIMG